ncbi:hypothetical protein BD626DRAFT_572300 [Schizophyllum amplum]|uniref:F-box domain-containing protein n=1 Tax=Schizophyllum amplum TaxID=97359 RepID=A0A550C514_9AGAR|nr:hypothetical protein BD626DRAFT_572300 [Auriculariopsis ampla]
MSATVDGLPALPMDVLINIQYFLSREDIISLRLTCRDLRRATLSRTVWIDALRAVMDANDVFPPTFPLDKMSLAELEHAVFAPKRFFKLVQQRGTAVPNGSLEPVSRRVVVIIDDKQPADEDEKVYGAAIRLLPGGRFVIATTRSAIYLLDIGYDLNPVIRTRPVFTVRRAQLVNIDAGDAQSSWHVNEVSTKAPSADLLLHISLDHRFGSGKQTSLVVYGITDIAGVPKGRQMGHLTFPQLDTHVRIHSVQGSRVAFTANERTIGTTFSIGVWDFANGSVVAWRTRNRHPLGGLCVLSQNSVVSHDRQLGLVVYNIPPLTPVTAGIQLVDVHPAIQYHMLEGWGEVTAYCRRGSDHFFDIHRRGTATRFIVQDLPPNFTEASVIPLKASSFTIYEDVPEDIVTITCKPALCVCEDGVFTGVDCSGVQDDMDARPLGAYFGLHLSQRRHGKDAQPLDVTVSLIDSDDPGYMSWLTGSIDFCPVSGRLCAMDHRQGLQLFIFDYLTPSPR